MVKHIVMWRFENSEDCSEVKRRLDELPSKISEIVEFEAGIDFNRGEPAYDLALYSTFKSLEDFKSYQVHPDHVEVAKFIGSVAVERAVVDYEI